MRTIGRFLVAFGVLGVFTGALAASQAGNASLTGVVVNDVAQPVRGATLTLSGTGLGGPRLAISADDGRFTFSGLPGGTFTLSALRPGYVTTAYGATQNWRSPGVPVYVDAGQRVTLQPIKLMRGAAVTGRALDSRGQPLEDVSVAIHEIRTLNGQQTLSNVPALGSPPSTASSSTAVTDDRGMFRIFGLPAGSFVVSVQPPSLATFEATTAADIEWAAAPASSSAPPSPPGGAPPVGYVPMYFPGVADTAAATVLTLTAGEERSGVDITVEKVRYARVTGTLTGPSGQTVPGAQVVALKLGAVPGAPTTPIPPLGGTNPDGNFTVTRVPPGRFMLMAQTGGRGNPAGQALFAQTEVTVNGTDVTGVSLQMMPGVTVSGRVAFDGRQAPFTGDLLRTSVRLTQPPSAVSVAIPQVQIGDDGAFRVSGVAPGSYSISATPPGADGTWMISSATLGSQNLLATTLDLQPGQAVSDIVLTLTDRVTEISGLLRDTQGRPSPDFYVIAYPVDRRVWSMGRERLRPAVRPDANGRYRIAGLAPGEYYLAAVTTMQPNDFADTAFLELLVPASLKLTVAPGEKKVQDVTLASQ